MANVAIPPLSPGLSNLPAGTVVAAVIVASSSVNEDRRSHEVAAAVGDGWDTAMASDAATKPATTILIGSPSSLEVPNRRSSARCANCWSAANAVSRTLHRELNDFVRKALPNDSKLCHRYGKRETPRTGTARIQKQDAASNLGSRPMGVTRNDGREVCGRWIHIEL